MIGLIIILKKTQISGSVTTTMSVSIPIWTTGRFRQVMSLHWCTKNANIFNIIIRNLTSVSNNNKRIVIPHSDWKSFCTSTLLDYWLLNDKSQTFHSYDKPHFKNWAYNVWILSACLSSCNFESVTQPHEL